MPVVYEYATSSSGKVHLVEAHPFIHRQSQTLCGMDNPSIYVEDETVSGKAATCKTCKRIVEKRKDQYRSSQEWLAETRRPGFARQLERDRQRAFGKERND